MKPIILLVIAALFTLTSCISNKEMLNFQDAKFTYDATQELPNKHTEYLLQAGDVLSIRVRSFNQENATLFNIQPDGGMNAFNDVASYINGYSISDSGFVRLPGIGNVKVVGKTVNEAARLVQLRVTDFIKDATVLVTLVSFKISILGEVNRPGYYFVYNNRCNLLEAIALGGDLKEFADRRNIQLIRQTAKGSEAIRLDLTSTDIFQSPYFYLRPNDVLYVAPLEARNKRSNLAVLNVFNIGIAAIATTITTINVINNIRATNRTE